MPKKDLNQLAKALVDQATGDLAPVPKLIGKKADSSKGGLKGGKARAEKLTPEERSAIAKKAAKTRWKE